MRFISTVFWLCVAGFLIMRHFPVGANNAAPISPPTVQLQQAQYSPPVEDMTPTQWTNHLMDLLRRSVAKRAAGEDAPMGTTACNPARHLAAAAEFISAGFQIKGLAWGGMGMVIESEANGERFNIDLDCTNGKREMTLRPFVVKNATDPRILDLFSKLISIDMKSDANEIRKPLERCLIEGREYTTKKRHINFWCETPTANAYAIAKDRALDYRVFLFKEPIADD